MDENNDRPLGHDVSRFQNLPTRLAFFSFRLFHRVEKRKMIRRDGTKPHLKRLPVGNLIRNRTRDRVKRKSIKMLRWSSFKDSTEDREFVAGYIFIPKCSAGIHAHRVPAAR